MVETKEGPFVVTREGAPETGKVVTTLKARVRLIGNPVRYLKHFDPIEVISPGVDEFSRQVVCPLMLKGFSPKLRYAIWTFDRLNNNELTLMDFRGAGPDPDDDEDCHCDCDHHHHQRRIPVADRRLFEWFSYYKLDVGENPGGPKGPDFEILIIVTQRFNKDGAMSQNGFKLTEIANPLEPAPWTDRERPFLNGEKLKKDLLEARKAKTPGEINAMLLQFEAEQAKKSAR